MGVTRLAIRKTGSVVAGGIVEPTMIRNTRTIGNHSTAAGAAASAAAPAILHRVRGSLAA
jgi:hypothetical protein